jgi:hypothetical protein
MRNWTENENFLLEIPLPEVTRTYSPIPHGIFINEVQELLDKEGLKVCDKKYLVNSKGTMMTGEYGICHQEEGDKEAIMSIGFQNSYNKTKKAGLYSGMLVLVCKNGMYTTKQGATYQRKHTGTALEDLRTQIVTTIQNAQDGFAGLLSEREAMKERQLSRQTIATLIGDMWLNEHILNTTQLNIIKDQMMYSEVFKEKTAWSMYNWVTEGLKDTHPGNYINSHLKAHTYISNKLQLSTERKNLYGVLEPAL